MTLEDIASHLGRINRFSGATNRPWTVANHCVLVALILRLMGESAEVQLCGLFHDAAEAYIGDISTPLKWAMSAVAPDGLGAYDEIERRVVGAIWERFALLNSVDTDSPIIKKADLIALVTEARDLLPAENEDCYWWKHGYPEPFEYTTEVSMYMAEMVWNDYIGPLDPTALYRHVAKALFREARS